MKNFEKNWDSFQTGFEILQKRTTEIAFSENFKHSELTASEKKSVLDEDISLESISRRLMEGKCNPILTYLMMTDSNIIVICGTGISANSGVVDVQITESELQKYNLSHSESVFDLEYEFFLKYLCEIDILENALSRFLNWQNNFSH